MKSNFKPTHSFSLNIPKGIKAADVHNTQKQGEKCWCLHCGRTYDWGDYIQAEEKGFAFQWCPYEDCNGDTFLDSLSWREARRDGAHPDFPEIPEYDKVYPMYND